MDMNFSRALAAINMQRMFKVANEARQPGDYLFATLLPEINKFDFDAKAGKMMIHATMAGGTGMDSAYAQVGHMAGGNFNNPVVKLTAESVITEQMQREIMYLVQNAANGADTVLVQESLNFLRKVIVQSLMDRSEWLRGQALMGAISWRYNNIEYSVDYGIPVSQIFANRTGADSYIGADSMFWSDYAAAQNILGQIRQIIMHPAMYYAIIGNPVNNVMVTAQQITGASGSASLQRYVNVAGNTIISSDMRDRININIYGAFGNAYDPSFAPSLPSMVRQEPFMSKNKVIFIGDSPRGGYVPGLDIEDEKALAMGLGYTHMAPSVEGANVTGRITPGRWARLRVPDARPWELVGEGVSNELPVIESPELIVVASSAIV